MDNYTVKFSEMSTKGGIMDEVSLTTMTILGKGIPFSNGPTVEMSDVDGVSYRCGAKSLYDALKKGSIDSAYSKDGDECIFIAGARFQLESDAKWKVTCISLGEDKPVKVAKKKKAKKVA